jgi:hypothetical protein
VPPRLIPVMSCPGATTEMKLPVSEKSVRWPSGPIAPTATTPGYAAGYAFGFPDSASFDAAVTISTSLTAA